MCAWRNGEFLWSRNRGTDHRPYRVAGSGPGAIIGGLIIGLIESLGAGLISSGYKDAFALLVLLFVLFLKPSGLLGSMEISKIKEF